MLASVLLKNTFRYSHVMCSLAVLLFPGIAAASPVGFLTDFGIDARSLLVAGIITGSMGFAVFAGGIFLRAASASRKAARRASEASEKLDRESASLRTLITAEPQLLIHWDAGGPPVLAAATLDYSAGVPGEVEDLVRFSSWLESESASRLKQHTDALIEGGEGFAVPVETLNGVHLETFGRVSAGGAILKIRDNTKESEEPASDGESDEEIAGTAMDQADQNALKRHMEAHTRTLDSIGTAVAIFSADQRLRYFNQAFTDLWELDEPWLEAGPLEGEILDALRQSSCLPEQANYGEWKQKHLEKYECEATFEDSWHLPDGRTVLVVANHTSDGSASYLYENITEELALKSRYNALIRVQKETLDHLREGVAVFASNGRLKLFNPAFASIWELGDDALFEEPHIDDVINWCRELLDDDEPWDEVKHAITSIDYEREPLEGQLNRPDGSTLAYAGLPLPDGATLLTYVDITDSKHVENALIERNEALVAADQLKSTFISHVNYELRTPLTNIIGFAELLTSPRTGTLNERQQEYLGDIRSSSDDLKTIINDILDLATIDAGALELSLGPVLASEVIDAAVVGVRERLKHGDLELEVSISDDVNNFPADGQRMTQVLFNLLSNAIGFSEPGSCITLDCHPEEDMIAFSVEDKGIGIPEDYQERTFDRFESRAHGSRHRGAGLGLTIVKNLVELHGGSVSLNSAPGVGTIVKVLLPLEHKADKSTTLKSREGESGVGASPAAATG